MAKLLKGELRLGPQKARGVHVGEGRAGAVPQSDSIGLSAEPTLPHPFFDDPDFGLKSPLFKTLEEAVIAAVPVVLQGGLTAQSPFGAGPISPQNSPGLSGFPEGINPALLQNSGVAGPQVNNPFSPDFGTNANGAQSALPVNPAVTGSPVFVPEIPSSKPVKVGKAKIPTAPINPPVNAVNPQIFGGGTLAGSQPLFPSGFPGSQPTLGTGFGGGTLASGVGQQPEKHKSASDSTTKPKVDRVAQLNARNKANLAQTGPKNAEIEPKNIKSANKQPTVLKTAEGTSFRLPSFLTVNRKSP